MPAPSLLFNGIPAHAGTQSTDRRGRILDSRVRGTRVPEDGAANDVGVEMRRWSKNLTTLPGGVGPLQRYDPGMSRSSTPHFLASPGTAGLLQRDATGLSRAHVNVISPPRGEMPGRAERGAVHRLSRRE